MEYNNNKYIRCIYQKISVMESRLLKLHFLVLEVYMTINIKGENPSDKTFRNTITSG